jgi:hypothetical protein
LKASVAALGLAACLSAASAQACPCSDDAGGALGLTRPGERGAFGLVATARRTQGRYDALSRYSPLAAGESEWSEELLARGALRLPEPVEWSGELGFAWYHFDAPGIHEERAGVGDALLRARTRVLDESMPHESFRPSLSLSALVRAPLGSLSREQSAGYGSGGVQLGLGAWELGAGFDTSRSVSPSLSLGLAGEVAYRFADDAWGRARRLGPRIDASASAVLTLTDWLSAASSLRLRLVGDVTLSGQKLPGTGERLCTLAGSALFALPSARLRSALTLAVEPPWSRLSMGGAAAVALSFGLTRPID